MSCNVFGILYAPALIAFPIIYEQNFYSNFDFGCASYS